MCAALVIFYPEAQTQQMSHNLPATPCLTGEDHSKSAVLANRKNTGIVCAVRGECGKTELLKHGEETAHSQANSGRSPCPPQDSESHRLLFV